MGYLIVFLQFHLDLFMTFLSILLYKDILVIDVYIMMYITFIMMYITFIRTYCYQSFYHFKWSIKILLLFESPYPPHFFSITVLSISFTYLEHYSKLCHIFPTIKYNLSSSRSRGNIIFTLYFPILLLFFFSLWSSKPFSNIITYLLEKLLVRIFR